MDETEKRAKAWVGDAVLALFAREWILGQKEIEPGNRIEVFTSLTSNQFLACIGEPTLVEARIGKVYSEDRLPAAFEFIQSEILPVFEKQRRNLVKRTRSYRDRK
jgi:dsRNA-specific ribonuclease